VTVRSAELKQVVDELAAGLISARVQKAFAPLPGLCYLELRQPGRTVLLVACAQRQLARISVGQSRFSSNEAAHPFQAWLRRELVGSTLTRMALRADRIVEMELQKGEKARKLIADLRGSSGMLLLLGEGDRVLAVSAEATAQERPAPGERYAPASEPARGSELASRLVPLEGEAFPHAAAAEAMHAGKEQAGRAVEIRRRLEAPLKARLARIARTLKKVSLEASRGPQAERHRQLGELIARNAHLIPRGARTASLVEYSEKGPIEVQVDLQPQRTAKQQSEWHFHQYRRLLRGCDHAAHRLLELEEETAQVQRALEELAQETDQDVLRQSDVLAAPRRRTQAQGRPFKEYFSAGGQRIWVGRDSKSNEELTFHLARPHHWWLHARGAPGSHVLVPLERNAELEPEVLVDAAHLALHHSGLKGEARAEVSYTRAKYVKKTKGQPAGTVSVTREQTFTVRLEPARIERLLRSRSSHRNGEAK
jgi:predicted ribosome quality control (RQC) complex YloA/Tae2 family protein